jgi:Pyruvate/2-oxoacid:ferredoxin oxidoreductase gamma subunit
MEDEEYKVYGVNISKEYENRFLPVITAIVVVIAIFWVVVGISKGLL